MDAAAALRCWPVEVELAGMVYTIPALPSADWVEAILTGDALAVVPGLCGAEVEEVVMDGLAADDLTDDEVTEAARDAVEAASGRPWWETYRLVGALTDTRMLGRLIAEGFDFETRSIGALVAAVYGLATANADDTQRARFDFDLATPPVEVLRDNPEAEADAFMAALAEQQGR